MAVKVVDEVKNCHIIRTTLTHKVCARVLITSSFKSEKLISYNVEMRDHLFCEDHMFSHIGTNKQEFNHTCCEKVSLVDVASKPRRYA